MRIVHVSRYIGLKLSCLGSITLVSCMYACIYTYIISLYISMHECMSTHILSVLVNVYRIYTYECKFIMKHSRICSYVTFVFEVYAVMSLHILPLEFNRLLLLLLLLLYMHVFSRSVFAVFRCFIKPQV